MKKRVGRPRTFTSPYILGEMINAYFDECDEADPPEPYTITGLCLAIGFTRNQIISYAKKDEFLPIIRQARLIIQHALELRLLGPGRVSGPIFALKQHGWSDKQELDITGKGKDGADEWKIEVVDVKPETDNADIPNSEKVTPFPGSKKAV